MKIVALIGPTAVGKTAHSFALAEALGAEIISADSRQVYRYMDVGTDKASLADRRRVVHHLIDVADPDEIFTAADFTARGEAAMNRMTARGRVPLLVGGTPFYYRALEGGALTAPVGSDPAFRASLEPCSNEELHQRLADLDPKRAQALPVGDRYRVQRALEIIHLTGRPASSFLGRGEMRHEVLYLGLIKNRDDLRRRIAQRVREQFEGGYPEEVAWLLEQGYSPELPSMKGFGYRELVLMHQGKMTYEQALEGDRIATCQFSKRQMTWFRQFDAQWFDLDCLSRGEVSGALVQAARAFLEG